MRGTARVYATPNFRLEGTVLYADGEVDFNVPLPVTQDFQTWLWRAKAEYKFATSPFSVFAAYEGSRTTASLVQVGLGGEDLRVTDHRVLAGIRLYLNENTLQFNDVTARRSTSSHRSTRRASSLGLAANSDDRRADSNNGKMKEIWV